MSGSLRVRFPARHVGAGDRDADRDMSRVSAQTCARNTLRRECLATNLRRSIYTRPVWRDFPVCHRITSGVDSR